MPRPTTVLVEPAELEALYDAPDLKQKVETGCFQDHYDAGVPAKSFPGVVSHIVKHLDADGDHICTTHSIFGRDDRTLHWDVADIKVGEVTIAKFHQPRSVPPIAP